MPEKKIGFTIGKFAPLHKGHQFVIETALKEMDEVYCVVYDTEVACCDIETRAGWLRRLYPDLKIILAFNSPKQYGLDDKSVKIQMEYLQNIIKDIPVTHFYSSELYGEKVASYLNIENRLVDLERKQVPIYANEIRFDLEKNKQFLEKFVYEDYIKQIKG